MKKKSEEKCIEEGGHCWNHYGANDQVDEFGNKGTVRYAVHFSSGEPRYRRCRHCGKTEEHAEEWI